MNDRRAITSVPAIVLTVLVIDALESMLPELEASIKKGINFLCLLYTSPSPRDATLSRMPSSA